MTNGFRKKKEIFFSFSKNNSGFDGNLFTKISKIMESRASIQSAVRLHLFEFALYAFHLFSVSYVISCACNDSFVVDLLVPIIFLTHFIGKRLKRNWLEIFSFYCLVLFCLLFFNSILQNNVYIDFFQILRICQLSVRLIDIVRTDFFSLITIALPFSLFVHFDSAVNTEYFLLPNSQIIEIWINTHMWNVKKQFFKPIIIAMIEKSDKYRSLFLAFGYSYSHASIIFFSRHHFEFATHSKLLREIRWSILGTESRLDCEQSKHYRAMKQHNNKTTC